VVIGSISRRIKAALQKGLTQLPVDAEVLSVTRDIRRFVDDSDIETIAKEDGVMIAAATLFCAAMTLVEGVFQSLKIPDVKCRRPLSNTIFSQRVYEF
jgi:hypothetical protein